MNAIREFQALPNRADLHDDTKLYMARGFLKNNLTMTTPDWIISAVSFLKWYYKIESALVAQSMAEKDGIYEKVVIAFKNECVKPRDDSNGEKSKEP